MHIGILSLSRHDFEVSLCFLAVLLLFAPSNTRAIILDAPVAGPGYSAIMTNGPASLSWTVESGDPSFITLLLQNNATKGSFQFATNVSSSSSPISRNMTNVPGSEYYFIQAVAVSNITKVLSTTDNFTVAGPSTNVPSTASAHPSTSSTSQISSTMIITPVVVGGLAFAAIVIAFTFYYHHRIHRLNIQLRSPARDDFSRRTETLSRTLSTGLSSSPMPFQGSGRRSNLSLDVNGRLEPVRSQSTETGRICERLQSEMGGDHASDNMGQLHPNSVACSSTPTEEADLRRCVELMSERVQQLEVQQHHLVRQDSVGRHFSMELPPDYVASSPVGGGTFHGVFV